MKTLFVFFIFCISNQLGYGQSNMNTEDPDFASYQINDLLDQLDEKGGPWLPFLRGKNVLTGLYRLKAGSEDLQKPHDTDEVYYVVSGKGKFKAGAKDEVIQSGSILFVKAEVEHRFYDITEDLVLVVFFDQ